MLGRRLELWLDIMMAMSDGCDDDYENRLAHLDKFDTHRACTIEEPSQEAER